MMTSPPRFMMVHRHQPMSDTDPVRFVIRCYRGGEVRRRPWQESGNGDGPPDGKWASLGPFWEYAHRITGGAPLDWAPDGEGWEPVDLATIPRPVIAGTGLVSSLYTDATRADLEKARPDELLGLLGPLWSALCCRPADDLVVPNYIDHLAALTVREDRSLPGWLAPSEATDRLRRPLMGALHEIGMSLGLYEEALNERVWGEEDGALWLTSHWAREVRRRWGEGYAPADDEARQKWAAHLAGDLSAAEVMRAWLDPEHEGPIPSPLVAWVARRVWGEELERLELVRAELEAAAPLVWQSNGDFLRRKHPSLLLAAAAPLVRSLVRARPMDGGLLVDADNRQIPLALRSTVEGLIVGDLAALGTTAAQRLVRMVVEAGAVAAYGDGRRVLYSTDPRVEVYRDRATGDAVLTCWGGWPAMGRLCGLEGNKGREQVKDAAYALAAVSLRWKGPKGGGADALLGVRDGDAEGEYRAAPGREARVVLRISPPLAPGLVHSMPKGRRALAPVLRDPPSLPRTLDRHAAAIGRADFLAMFEARALAPDLYSKDRMALPWDRVFEEAAVPRQARGPALEALQGSPEAPRWVRLSETFWTLADTGPTGDALAWLKEAGRQEVSGSRAGKAGAATRQGRAKRRKP